MTGTSLRWGAFAPQGWKLEYTGWSGPDAWARTVELSALAEQLGYDHLWVYDHVETVPRREPTHVFEAFTMLAALSQRTDTIRLGQMVTCASYRNAGLLAKEAATLDVMSEGRLILGMGAGWYEEEYHAYGFEFLPAGDRLRILDETIEVIRRMWTEETVTFDGRYLQFDGAYCDPKPVQQLPEIWIGGGGEKVTLRIAAEHADGWNVPFIAPEAYAHKVEVLTRHCADVGRDPATIEKAANVGLAMRPGDLEAQFGAMAKYVAPGVLHGSVGEVVDRVGAYEAAGADWLILAVRAPFDLDGLDQFASDVLPQLR
jgi:F420-dependent oxidoreductase-like protein